MHFFNPVRYMKLLELVAGPDTSPETLDRVRRFGEDVLGKGVVVGKDTPNFVGNRIGCHAMLTTIHLMLEEGLAPEDVDAHHRRADRPPEERDRSARPTSSASTRFVHVADNCYASLTADEDRKVFEVPALHPRDGREEAPRRQDQGRLLPQGQGRLRRDARPEDARVPRRAAATRRSARKCKELAKIEDVRERLRKLFADDGKAGRFAWKVLSRSLAYSARRIGEITDDITAIDEAMRWGYNWELGPFETWDALGFEAVLDRMKKDGVALPASIDKMRAAGAKSFYTADGRVFDLAQGRVQAEARADPRTATLTALRKGSAPVLKNDGAEAWDLGDGVLGLTFKTKANSIDSDVIKMIERRRREGGDRLPRARRRQPGRALLRRREPVPRRDGGAAEGVGADPVDGEGLPARLPADEVRDASRSSPRRTG